MNPIRFLLPLFVTVLALTGVTYAHAQSAQPAFTQVAFQRDVTCGIRDDGSVVCDAPLLLDQLRVPENLPPAQEISVARTAACVVLVDGGLQCWGRDDFGLTSPPSGGEPYSSVSISNTHGCVINRDNGIDCWGLPDNDRLQAPAGAYQQLTVGQQNGCAVDMNGTVACWGANDSGSTDVPVDLPAAQQVSASPVASCALLLDGSIQCWGRDVAIPVTEAYVAVHANARGGRGDAAVCGIRTNGTLDCAFTDLMGNQSSQITPDDPLTGLMVFDVSLSFSSNSAQTFCYVETSGAIGCSGRTVPAVFTVEGDTVPATTGLRADVYSSTTIELFWDAPRRAFVVAGHEIQRNGEVIAFTQNLSSYLVDDLVPGDSATFAVRQVSTDGATGAYSDSIVVTTDDLSGGAIAGPDNSGYQPPARPFEPAGVRAFVYGDMVAELIWDRPATSAITGYEIRRNGVFVGFTNGTSYLEELPSQDALYHYDIIPVNQNDDSVFYGFSSIDVEVGAVCR